MQCKTCSPSARKKAKISEKRLEWYLKTWAEEKKIPMYSTWDKQISGVDPVFCDIRRPDFLYDFGHWVLVIENDEFSHATNDSRCEHVRIQDITNSFGSVPIQVIRFNPHGFKVSGKTRKTGVNERMEYILKLVQKRIADGMPENHINISYLFYRCDRCKSSKECSFLYVDTFKTMVDYGNYIQGTYPLENVGNNPKPGPSANAKH
jgi:hypothetical protein